jgi:hypothetical protein
MRVQKSHTIRQACLTANEGILARRPSVIRLADILMAMDTLDTGHVFLISAAGVFASYRAESGMQVYQDAVWNLHSDALTDQTDACIDFLYDVLQAAE